MGSVAGAITGAAIASGVSGVASNILGVNQNNRMMNFQSEENALNRAWQTAEAEKARQFNTSERIASQDWQKGMMDLQNAYNSPVAMAQRYRAAGLNPNLAMTGAATQNISASSGSSSPASSPMPSQVSGLSPVSFQPANLNIAEMVNSLGNFQKSIAEAEKSGMDTRLAKATFDDAVNKFHDEANLTNLEMAAKEMDNFVLSSTKDAKIKYAWEQLKEIGSKIALNEASGKELNARADLNIAMKRMNDALAGYHGQNAEYMRLKVSTFMRDFNSMLSVRESEKVRNYSVSSLNNALAKTENDLRSGRVELLSLQNDLQTIEKFMQGNELKASDETLNARIFGLVESYYREGLISENVYKEGQILSTRRDWAARQEFADYLGKVVGAASSALNSYSNLRGVNLQRLSAKERNAIKDRFVREYEHRGNFDRDNKLNFRDKDDFPLYVPDGY